MANFGGQEGHCGDIARPGQVAMHRGEYDQAANLFTESLVLKKEEAGDVDKERIAYCLAGFAALWETRGQPQRVVRLLGAAQVLLEGIVTAYDSIAKRADYERTVAAIRARLSEAT